MHCGTTLEGARNRLGKQIAGWLDILAATPSEAYIEIGGIVNSSEGIVLTQVFVVAVVIDLGKLLQNDPPDHI